MPLSFFLALALAAPAGSIITPNRIVAGVDEGAGSTVRVRDYATSTSPLDFAAYAGGFAGGVRVAAGDISGDGFPDVITGAGPAGSGHVKVFDGVLGTEIRSFLAFPIGFSGGVYVAAGDVNGDGRADLVVGAGSGSAGGHVKVFDGRTQQVLRDFLAFDPAFTGGVRVAAGDVNGDGAAEIVAGSGPGGVAVVRAFDGRSGAVVRNFVAYGAAYTGGVFVAAADLDGDGRADFATGTDSGGPPQVKVFDGITLVVEANFFAYTPGFTGGVRVAAGDVTGDRRPDLVTAPGAGASLPVNVYGGPTLQPLAGYTPFASPYAAGTFVAARAEPDVLLSDGFE